MSIPVVQIRYFTFSLRAGKTSYLNSDTYVYITLRSQANTSINSLNNRLFILYLNRFKARYQRDEIGEEGEGEMLLIVPRDPQHGVSEETEGTVAVDLHSFDGPDELHHGMVLKEDEVGELTFCCCECCHLKACHGLSKLFCNVFPQHCTANQFFTPRLFSAYHREGHRACVEANVDAFLKDTGGERQQRETRM